MCSQQPGTGSSTVESDAGVPHESQPSTSYSTGTQQWQVGDGGAAADATQREALRIEIARLQNATAHLESSNSQLQQALTADPSDADFKQALGENIVVIAKYRAQVATLQQELAAAGSGAASATGQQQAGL